ncbi:DUF6115 domain-containing protein [Thalassobacillus hwangdonensis]|uniref:DUF6115 domain-containing protein n=1 Tax=Thalassobacillus hwangdonensis TaxID=546108 RepID=A0ABW3KWE9_9BACI
MVTTLLFVVSFLLHGVTVLVLIILATRMKRAEDSEQNQKQATEEIEQLFSAYLMEIKDENDRLKQLLEEASPVLPKVESERMEAKVHVPVDHIAVDEQDQEDIKHGKVNTYQPPSPDVQDTVEVSLNTKVARLHQEGFSAEEIARRLGRGLTEVELMLKFNR